MSPPDTEIGQDKEALCDSMRLPFFCGRGIGILIAGEAVNAGHHHLADDTRPRRRVRPHADRGERGRHLVTSLARRLGGNGPHLANDWRIAA